MQDRDQILKRMKVLEAYFGNGIKEHKFFEPEYEAASQINEIFAKPEIGMDEVNEIVSIINKLSEIEHYNGTGWLDFKMHISSMLKLNYIKNEWHDNGKLLILNN